MKSMRFTLTSLLFAPLFALSARATNWTLVADSGQNLNNNGATATIQDSDLPNNKLCVTVENAADHTLMLGRNTTDYAKQNATARIAQNASSPHTAAYSGPIDLAKPIFAAGDDTPWTIVSVAPMAFYNNKALLTAPNGILDLSSVTNIGIGAFGNVTAMPGFRLSPKLERVGASAFMSTFQTTSHTPQFPPSLKVIETTAFGHNDQYDADLTMDLQGEIELRGAEVIESAAFYKCQSITAVTIGPKLRSFGVKGTVVRQKNATQGVFEKCDALTSVTWLGPAPESFQHNAFWTDNTSVSVTNWVYVDYFDGWTNLLKATQYTIGAKAADADVWRITPTATSHKGKVWLSLLPGHPPVEGAAIFNDAPTMSQSGNVFTFRANLSEGEDCDLFAVFTATDGTAVTNVLASAVDGDPDEFYTLTPTGLTADRTYAFGVLGVKGTEHTFRSGVGTFFNGEVSVSAPAAFSEAGGSGSFTFSRNGTDGDLVIPLAVSGTAHEFDNFLELPRSITIPDGASSATVTATGVVDLTSDADASLTLATRLESLFLVASGAATATTTIENWVHPAVSSFGSVKTYTVAGYDESRVELENFPILVRIPDGAVPNPAQLAFFDENDNPLHFEIDTWNASGESLVWVSLPLFAQGVAVRVASGLVGYSAPNLGYGLWRKAGYVLVLHCGDEGPALAGSTVQGIGGTARSANNGAAGSEGLVAAGAAGAARTISSGAANATDWGAIRVENYERYMADAKRFTVSLWFNHRSGVAVGDERLFGNRLPENNEVAGFTARFDKGNATNAPAFIVSGNSTQGPAGFVNYISVVSNTDGSDVPFSGAWTHASFSFQPADQSTFFSVAGARASCRQYTNNKWVGGYVSEITNLLPIDSVSSTAPVFFGHGSATQAANSFKGAMDEIRVRDGVVSDDWAFAEYETIHNASFLKTVSDSPAGIMFLIY